MAEDSMLWTTSGTGDGPSGGYTQQNWLDFHRYLFNPDLEATAGVLPRKGNTLACSGTASPVAVNTGAAFVYGFFYKNTASLNLTVTTPTLGTTGFRVVLRASWAAQTVRAAIVSNSNGVAAIPAVTQSAGTTWEISLATGTITTGGVIALTDARIYLNPAFNVSTAMIEDAAVTSAKLRNSAALSVIGRSANSSGVPADIAASAASGAVLRESGSTIGFGTVATAGIANDAIDDTKVGNRVPQFYRRQGGAAGSWITTGTSTQTPGMVRMQGGAVVTTAVSSTAVAYPTAFSQVPLVFAYTPYAVCYTNIQNITASGFDLQVLETVAPFGRIAKDVYWLAIGTE